MALLGRSRTTVGLDIGSGLIKLVVISHGSNGPTLTKVAFTQVVDDAIVEGEVMDPGIVSEAIKGLFASSGIKPKQIVTAVGGRDVIIKKISMDRMRRRKRARSSVGRPSSTSPSTWTTSSWISRSWIRPAKVCR